MTALGNLEALDLHAAPRRVVSLVPSVTESLFDLGAGERVVAVTDYCVHPAGRVQALPKIGGTKNPDLARVRAALPDLIIANREENRKDDVEALQAEGFKVWVTFPCTVAETFELLWAMIRLFDLPHMSQAIDSMERVYEYAVLAAENTPPVKVFCPIWRDPPVTESAAPRWWMTINRATYVHDVLRVCGGQNVFADRERRYPLAADLAGPDSAAATVAADEAGPDTRYPRVTPAEVAAQAPDVILLPSEPYPFTDVDRAAFEADHELPAVKAGRIHCVDGSLLTWPGTRVGRALAELPAYLSALSFDSPDP